MCTYKFFKHTHFASFLRMLFSMKPLKFDRSNKRYLMLIKGQTETKAKKHAKERVPLQMIVCLLACRAQFHAAAIERCANRNDSHPKCCFKDGSEIYYART